MLCIICVICGCVSFSSPPDNKPFIDIIALKQIEGVYQNIGVSSDPENPPLLAQIIWPEDGLTKNKSVSTIEVRAISNEALKVMALNQKDELLHYSIFNSGKDFELKDGKIVIYSGWYFYKGGDDPLVGPKYEKIELGIDNQGNAKYSNIGGGAGLVYMVFPIAATAKYEARFEKIR